MGMTKNYASYLMGDSEDDPTKGGQDAGPDPADPSSTQGQQVSAVQAGYVDAAPACDNCTHFVADGSPCEVVSDPVAAAGWCKLYEKGEEALPPAPLAGPDAGAPPPEEGAI